MKTCYLLILVIAFVSSCSSATKFSSAELSPEAETIHLWPKGYLGETGKPAQVVMPSEGDNITRLTDVTDPSITVYKPAATQAPTAAVLVCPGGGYNILAIDLEGTEIAEWLNSNGITAVVLKYRVPDNRSGAFEDVQRAMALIRHHAADWNIDPVRVGVIGFSAGGNLAGKLSTDFQTKSYDPVDEADRLSCRPDFAILVYPYLLAKDGKLADDMNVVPETPSTILIHAQDDWVDADSSILYYRALKKVKVPSELHVFPSGGHGYGLRSSKHAVSCWPKLCEVWLQKTGVIKKADKQK
ncbi:MAG: alpha/beta hydrolase [Planctomycetota bacterium]|jgi:acetyl esterase/lipase